MLESLQESFSELTLEYEDVKEENQRLKKAIVSEKAVLGTTSHAVVTEVTIETDSAETDN